MLLTSELAEYLRRASAVLEDETKRTALLARYPHLGSRCTECDSEVLRWDERGGHVVFETPAGEVIVVIGCEGYWMVNPNHLGLVAPDWDNASDYGTDDAS